MKKAQHDHDTGSKQTQGSTSSDKRSVQWEALMRKFSIDHQKECKTVTVTMPRATRSLKQFPTGSSYEGSWDVLGMSGYGVYTFPNGSLKRFSTGLSYEGSCDVLAMSGYGVYTFPNGVVYEGDMEDGMFNGDGELRYPSGVILRGQWSKGTLYNRTLYFADGLRYWEKDWNYCEIPDRRFAVEYEYGFQPAGKSYLTAEQPTREIPPGFYDVGDGFYDPEAKVVYSADECSTIIRSPSLLEQKWILDNCRTNPDVPLGPKPSLYEAWPQPHLPATKLGRLECYASSYERSFTSDDYEVSAEDQDQSSAESTHS